MLLRLHGVFLAILVLTLLHDLTAARAAPDARKRPFEQWLLLPLLGALAAVLVWDRVHLPQPSLLNHAWVAALFPLVYLLSALQNLACLLQRGVRLLDIPMLLANVGLGACVFVSAASLHGMPLGFQGDRLLYQGSVLQGFFGTRLADVWTLGWPLPWLLRRRTLTTVPGFVLAMGPVALAALTALMLAALHGPAAEVVSAFHLEPSLEQLPADLTLAILTEGAEPPGVQAQGAAWRLPLDVDLESLPPPPRPLVLELTFPARFAHAPPSPEDRDQAFVHGAARLAARLKPELLLPVPEPDGEGTLHFGADTSPEHWRQLLERVAAAVAPVSPDTRLGVRFAGAGPRTAAMVSALLQEPSPVAVLGPRLEPGGHAPGQGSHADALLNQWELWLESVPRPPQLWILRAGLSPLAFGEHAQARFLLGCVARAASRPAVVGVLLTGGADKGHTQGLLRPDGSPRAAALTLTGLLQRPRGPARSTDS